MNWPSMRSRNSSHAQPEQLHPWPIHLSASTIRLSANWAGLLDETKLTEIEYAWGEHRIRVTRAPAAVHATSYAAPAASAAPQAPAAPEPDNFASHPGAVKSPMVGTVYLSPQPGAPAYVRVGDQVSAGQPLLIIEAMKVMNQIRAPKGGQAGAHPRRGFEPGRIRPNHHADRVGLRFVLESPDRQSRRDCAPHSARLP